MKLDELREKYKRKRPKVGDVFENVSIVIYGETQCKSCGCILTEANALNAPGADNKKCLDCQSHGCSHCGKALTLYERHTYKGIPGSYCEECIDKLLETSKRAAGIEEFGKAVTSAPGEATVLALEEFAKSYKEHTYAAGSGPAGPTLPALPSLPDFNIPDFERPVIIPLKIDITDLIKTT